MSHSAAKTPRWKQSGGLDRSRGRPVLRQLPHDVGSGADGNPLGCSECYAVFSDVIVSELVTSKKLPVSLQKTISAKKTQPIHIGKSPTKPIAMAPSSRLTELNEALNDALKRGKL